VRRQFQSGYCQEFANLIVVQQAFEVNTKAVTTFDQITQDTINLKQGQAAGKQT
jgi:flagellar hook protein FlgE